MRQAILDRVPPSSPDELPPSVHRASAVPAQCESVQRADGRASASARSRSSSQLRATPAGGKDEIERQGQPAARASSTARRSRPHREFDASSAAPRRKYDWRPARAGDTARPTPAQPRSGDSPCLQLNLGPRPRRRSVPNPVEQPASCRRDRRGCPREVDRVDQRGELPDADRASCSTRAARYRRRRRKGFSPHGNGEVAVLQRRRRRNVDVDVPLIPSHRAPWHRCSAPPINSSSTRKRSSPITPLARSSTGCPVRRLGPALDASTPGLRRARRSREHGCLGPAKVAPRISGAERPPVISRLRPFTASSAARAVSARASRTSRPPTRRPPERAGA